MKLTIAKSHKLEKPLQSLCRAAIHARNAQQEIDRVIGSMSGMATAATIDGLIATRERIKYFSMLCQSELFSTASRDHGRGAHIAMGWPCDMSEG